MLRICKCIVLRSDIISRHSLVLLLLLHLQNLTMRMSKTELHKTIGRICKVMSDGTSDTRGRCSTEVEVVVLGDQRKLGKPWEVGALQRKLEDTSRASFLFLNHRQVLIHSESTETIIGMAGITID